MAIKWVKSPNFSVGRGGLKPEAIVIHIMEGTLADDDETSARTTLRIRKGIPTTGTGIAGKAKTGDSLTCVGWTNNGQTVDGNSHWYKDKNGDYFWAGGTTRPIPGLP